MTRLEAIAILDGFKYNPLLNEQHFEALDMAISALSEQKSLKEKMEKLYLEESLKEDLENLMNENERLRNALSENKGEWIPKERATECSVDVDIVCSECGYVGIEGYAHGYELNELPVQEMKDYIKKFDMNYCTCCGAKMKGGE